MASTTRTEILDALHTRRSVPRVRPEQPPRAVIEQLVAAAASAPNHFHTEPWRFIVLAGDGRQQLGEVIARAYRRRLDDPDSPEAAALIARERQKPMRAPVVIAVAAVPSREPKIVEIEEIAATAAAVENLLLAAHALDLGAMWRTGWPAYDAEVKRFLGLPEHAHVVSFVYLGYPDEITLPDRKRNVSARTTWLGWDDDACAG